MKSPTPSQFSNFIRATLKYLIEGREKALWVRYSSATTWVALALAARALLDEIVGDNIPFDMFLIATLLAAWCGGSGPALYALLLGIALGDWFFLPPRQNLGNYGPVEWSLVLGTIVPGLIAIGLFETLHVIRQRLRAEKQALATEIARRKALEQDLEKARAQVTNYAVDLEAAVAQRTRELNDAVGFLERFCHSIAHDLRAPVRAMLGFTRMLVDDPSVRLSPAALEFAGRIVVASKRMNQLVSDLLEYGRLSHVRLHQQEVEPGIVLSQVLEGLETMIRQSSAQVNVRSSLGRVWADPNLLHHVLHHLIRNAIEFARPGVTPQIAIYDEETAHSRHLFVCDNGAGIPREYLGKVFGVFQTLKFAHEHTGIGLAIVAKAVERMSGTISVHSKPGTGTTFIVELPKGPVPQVKPQRPDAVMPRVEEAPNT